LLPGQTGDVEQQAQTQTPSTENIAKYPHRLFTIVGLQQPAAAVNLSS
jgi:hypothetical protein